MLQKRLDMAQRGLGEQLWLHHQQPVGPLPSDNVTPPIASAAPPPGQLQLELPGLTRDWTRVDLGALPQLRDTDPALEQALVEQAKAHRWTTKTRQYFRHVLRIATFHFGPGVAVPEAELRAIAACHGRVSPRRLFPLLAEHGMFAPATAAATPDGHERWVHARLANLPEGVQGDVGVWIAALRGQGRRHSVAVTWSTVATYLNFAEPAVREWAACYGTLRAVVRQDVEDAVRQHRGKSSANVRIALRSLFRGLKRERCIFTDPAQTVTARQPQRLPRPLPLNQLRGVLDRLTDPRARLVVALVAIHALGIEDLRALKLGHYDAARGTIAVERGGLPFTFTLDALVARLMAEWLRTRHERWPLSLNPHLLITRFTAHEQVPMSRYGLGAPFRQLGITARQLRTDRILDEAHHTADPVQLMRVFGLGVTTAVSYVRAAHPDRFAADPTSA
ncbi:hypothetical protein [Amycolatopsis sp. NPDC098790]|uniref:hypothetical protein n=1 Tax=Amycolatopsis sp. NPDC098790 TaxID=3363939 RepID=UPI0037F6A141